MSSQPSFAELMERVRDGDQQAATDLLRLYEPAIRRAIRLRLTDARMRAVLDSMDICQSVMASFFLRAAAGQYDLETPEQLRNLLVAMARNKLFMQVRRERAQKRDNQREVQGLLHEQDVAGSASSPSRQIAAKELLSEVNKRLTEDERRLVELRQQGWKWDEIAGQLQGNADALRKKMERALDRVAAEVGVEEYTDE